ncbi:hypothetical protein [Streptomyces virginiae]
MVVEEAALPTSTAARMLSSLPVVAAVAEEAAALPHWVVPEEVRRRTELRVPVAAATGLLQAVAGARAVS